MNTFELVPRHLGLEGGEAGGYGGSPQGVGALNSASIPIIFQLLSVSRWKRYKYFLVSANHIE